MPGLKRHTGGEEGDANNSYAGADKVDLNLPESQMRLLKAVCETGTPVILLCLHRQCHGDKRG